MRYYEKPEMEIVEFEEGVLTDITLESGDIDQEGGTGVETNKTGTTIPNI